MGGRRVPGQELGAAGRVRARGGRGGHRSRGPRRGAGDGGRDGAAWPAGRCSRPGAPLPAERSRAAAATRCTRRWSRSRCSRCRRAGRRSRIAQLLCARRGGRSYWRYARELPGRRRRRTSSPGGSTIPSATGTGPPRCSRCASGRWCRSRRSGAPTRCCAGRRFALAVTALGLAFLTQSRGVLLGFCCGAVVALALGPDRIRRAWLAILAVAAIAACSGTPARALRRVRGRPDDGSRAAVEHAVADARAGRASGASSPRCCWRWSTAGCGCRGSRRTIRAVAAAALACSRSPSSPARLLAVGNPVALVTDKVTSSSSSTSPRPARRGSARPAGSATTCGGSRGASSAPRR